jgi:hypothetical protein
MNAYLLTFDDTTVTRSELLDCVNQLDGVENWLAFLPATIALVSPYSAHEITVALKLKRPGIRFVITPFNKFEADGLLPGEVWDFLNNPRPVLKGLFSLPATSR